MSICLSACISEAAIGRISTKFDIGNLYEKSVEKTQIGLKFGQQYRTHCVETYVRFIVVGDIKWQLRHFFFFSSEMSGC